MEQPGSRNYIKTIWHLPHGKAILGGLAALIFFTIAYVVGYFMYLTDDATNLFGDEKAYNFFKCFGYSLLSGGGLSATVVIFLIVVGILVLMSFMADGVNRADFTDERGVVYDKMGMYGTAHPMRKREAMKVFEFGPIEKVQGPILGQWSSGGRECVCLDPKSDRNRNIAVFGSPGTGKSFCYVRGAVYQAVRRGESMLVTDPKGEIYCDMAGFLRNQGYEVRVFDLVDMQASDAWDCMEEIFNPVTGDLDQLRLNEFSTTIFTNTSQGKEDPFWGVGEKNLFTATIAFTAYMYEKDLKRVFLKAAKMLFKQEDPEGKIIRADYQAELLKLLEPESDTTMNDRRKTVRYILQTYHGEENVEDELNKIESGEFTHDNGMHRCDISTAYYMLIGKTLDDIEQMFENERIPLHHVAAISWSIFKNGGDNVKPGFVTGLTQRLYLFQMRDLRRITSKQSHDMIKLERMGEVKCAYFCVISDKSPAMRPISSLFFNFFFRDVADAADRYGPENRIAVNVIADEFANLGAIPGFEVTIATVRSRKINISIILQSITQLRQTYEENNANTIIACCDTILFLGCNDTETAEFISDLSGQASIRADSTKENVNAFGNRLALQGVSRSDGGGKRAVYNPDEVRRLSSEEVLIYLRGYNILKAHRCGFIEHPYFKAGMPPKELLSQRLPATVRFKDTENFDAFYANDINAARRAQEAEQAKKYKDSESNGNGEDGESDTSSKSKPTGRNNTRPTHRNGRNQINTGGRNISSGGRSLIDD